MKKYLLASLAALIVTATAIAGPFAVTAGGASGGGGGSGTVTSVGVTTANGVSGATANPTTTPRITFTLGDITPSSVTTGTVTSTSIQGTLTGVTGTLSSPTLNTPTLVAPALGTPTSGVATNLTGTASGLTAGTATHVVTNANLTGPITSTGNATAVGAQTGTGSTFVMQTSPTLNTPTFTAAVLGTPQSGTLTNATGLPISTGVTGLGTGVATALGTNVGSAGAPVVNGGALGTPSSGTLTNATGLPLSTGVTGTLNAAQFPALTGAVTTSAGTTTTVLSTVVSGGTCTSCNLTVGNDGRITALATGAGGSGATLGANTFTDTQTITPPDNSPAITLSANTTGVGTITTTGAVTVTGSGTKFLSQLKGGDSITPAGESARTVKYVNSDTSLVLTTAASGSHSGVAYTLAPVAFSVGPNGKATQPYSSPGAGLNSERFGDGSTAAGDNSVVVGATASAAGAQGVAVGWGSQAGGSLGVSLGYLSSANAGVAVGANSVATDGGNGTAIAVGYQASTNAFQSMVFGRGQTATADGQLIMGTSVTAAARIVDVYIGGGRVSATPVGITYHGTGGSGSNIVGSNVAIAGGISTGTGASGNVQIQTAPTLQTSGSTANTLVDRQIVSAAGTALTSGTATALVDVALPTLAMAGGRLKVNVVSTDGTDMQSLSCEVMWSAVNKGAVYTSSIKTPSGGTADDTTCAKSVSAGTITAAWTMVSGTNKITIKLNVTTSLTATKLRAYYVIENDSEQAITPL